MDSFADEQSEKRRRGRAAIKKKKGEGVERHFFHAGCLLFPLIRRRRMKFAPHSVS